MRIKTEMKTQVFHLNEHFDGDYDDFQGGIEVFLGQFEDDWLSSVKVYSIGYRVFICYPAKLLEKRSNKL